MKLNPAMIVAVSEMVRESLNGSGGIVEGTKWRSFVDAVIAADATGDVTEQDVFGILWEGSLLTHPESRPSVDECVAQICDILSSWPRTYFVDVALPGVLLQPGFSYVVADDIDVFSTNELWPPRAAGFAVPADRNKTHLRVRVRGVYSRLGANGALLSSAWSRFRQFLYLLTSRDAFLRAGGFSAHRPECRLVNESGQQFLVNPPASLVDYMAGIIPKPMGVSPAEDLITGLSQARRFYSLPASNDRDRLSAAMEWLVDAESGADETMAYIAACIGIETLLGESETEVQTTRLQDRYSHLMGGTRSVRQESAKQMREVFHMRGQLVHGRRIQRLRGRELSELQKARTILRFCLEKELSAFLGDDAS